MLYYRVRPEFDNVRRYRYIGSSNLRIKPDGILIANELYTPRERERLAVTNRYFDRVKISRRRVYWCFGARFECRGVETP